MPVIIENVRRFLKKARSDLDLAPKVFNMWVSEKLVFKGPQSESESE